MDNRRMEDSTPYREHAQTGCKGRLELDLHEDDGSWGGGPMLRCTIDATHTYQPPSLRSSDTFGEHP